MTITDMTDDFYLVKLSDIEDYRQALFEGPWKIADHYLIVQRWRPFFSLTASISQKVVVWVRIPNLPIELCNEKLLPRIGNTIGNMLKIDKVTSLQSRGKFARICVELDLDKSLASHFYLRGKKLVLDSCREMLEVELATGNSSTVVVQNQSPTLEPSATEKPEVQAMQTEQNPPADSELKDMEMGPWNIPKYIAKKRKAGNGKSGHKNNNANIVQEHAPRVMKKTHVEVVNGEIDLIVKNPSKDVEDQIATMIEDKVEIPKAKPVSKPRVRNPIGGKNPQLAVKGKKLAKPAKTSIRKEKSIKKGENNGNSGVTILKTMKTQSLGKEDIPSTSNQAANVAINNVDEAAVMA